MGVEITASGNTVGGSLASDRNVLSGNTDAGVVIEAGATGNSILGNYIGTDASGTGAVPNGDGVVVIGDDNVVGAPGAGNLGSGNTGWGVITAAPTCTPPVGTSIQANRIGTNAAGTAAVGNGQAGVAVVRDSLVGGTAPGAGNLISGNQGGVASFLPFCATASGHNTIQGNLIGTNAAGTGALPNTGQGVSLGTANNTVGGTAAGARNVISGNGSIGVLIQKAETGNASNNVVQGNYIGTDVTGASALGNVDQGVRIVSSPNNVIGGPTTAARNVIASTTNGSGIAILGDGADFNLIDGNYIGTDAAGTAARGNNGAGVNVSAGVGNVVGFTESGAGNVLAANSGRGVIIIGPASSTTIRGNRIGTDATGTVALGNGKDGVAIADSLSNLVGGGLRGSGNVIANNHDSGVVVLGNSHGNK